MSKKELRGASRREFIKGALAIGAALGWGPARIWDFIARGAGEAAASCATKGIQKLVVLVGGGGAHGYATLLFPHPDMFGPGRESSTLSSHFMQDENGGGSTLQSQRAQRTGLANQINYSNPMAEDSPSRGKWAAGERYRRYYDCLPDTVANRFKGHNQAFGGHRTLDTATLTASNAPAMSRATDVRNWGSETVPKNLSMPAGRSYMIVSRETPWIHKYGPSKAITSIDGGRIQTFHVNGSHNHYIDYTSKRSVYAAAAVIQLANPTIVPVILVGNNMNGNSPVDSQVYYGAAGNGVNSITPGQPPAAFVPDFNGMVGLFSSNAAKAGGALTDPRNAVLYEAYTKGMIGSSKTARLPSFTRGYRTAKLGANLVGLNLADKLAPNDADRVRYGYTGTGVGTDRLATLRDNLIVTAKALRLGLTNQVVIQYFNDDPHSSFSFGGQSNTGDNAATVALGMSNFLNAFMDDLMEVDDPHCSGVKLGNNTVIAFVGDTPRTNVSKNAWNDPTFGGQNRAYIMSNGLLRSGFFGGDRPLFPGEGATTSNGHDSKGPGEGGLFDPVTGDHIPFDPTKATGTLVGAFGAKYSRDDMRHAYGELAMAAVLYAVTRGDIRRVNDFYTQNIVPELREFPALQRPILI